MFFRIPPLALCLFACVEDAPRIEARLGAMAMSVEVDSSYCGGLNGVGLGTLSMVRVMRNEEREQSEV